MHLEGTALYLFYYPVFPYGAVLEIAQLYLPYRTFNPLDIAANASEISSLTSPYVSDPIVF